MIDENRRAILARRARFVAAALAGVSGCGGTTTEPKGEPPTEIVVPSATAEQGAESDAAPPPRADAGVAQPPEPKRPLPQICLSEY